ncbi:hypothetical protein MMYC01_204491 [Madurella mycetomatis]|uniref:Uncharacterized protein n=1 Tax=Madurella mycetomatis TaxID=100816 RepID=A0A175W5R3_9PEZI|nr:hypothetical protein MMYC01_205292 [Madurella mycetomatis]KXX79582.1 hypothetical protein MMYC01_204491 [Madurella mycetomatis]
MTTILDIPGSQPPNPFSEPIQSALTALTSGSGPTLDDTAAHIVATVTDSPNPAHALWELWDAFFTAVATCQGPQPHAPHLALLDALRAQPPTQPSRVRAGSDADRQLRGCTQSDGKLHWSALPRFGAQWRDVHDILEAWRDWDGVRASADESLSHGAGEYYLRFCAFSAALLGVTAGEGGVHPIWVFHACRNVLERESPQPCGHPKPHRIPPEQVLALDVRVAATWVRDGGRALWETGSEELRRHWAAALDRKTELWPKEDGLTRERWQLWAKRLHILRTAEPSLDQETKAVVTEASEVVERILQENPT